MGFGVPLGTWLQRDLRPLLTERLLGTKAACTRYFVERRLRPWLTSTSTASQPLLQTVEPVNPGILVAPVESILPILSRGSTRCLTQFTSHL